MMLQCFLVVFAVIVSDPVSQTIYDGEMTQFNCTGVGSSINWVINGTVLSRQFQEHFGELGFTMPGGPVSVEGGRLIKLNVDGSTTVNSTELQCFTYDNTDGYTYSETALLIVVGELIPIPNHVLFNRVIFIRNDMFCHE